MMSIRFMQSMNLKMTMMRSLLTLTLTESTFFDSGSVVGKTSGARGRVIQFSNADLKLYYVALE